MYKVIVDNFMSWLKCGSTNKDHDYTFLNFKAIARCGDPKLLAYAMTSYIVANNLNTNNRALEGHVLFGATSC